MSLKTSLLSLNLLCRYDMNMSGLTLIMHAEFVLLNQVSLFCKVKRGPEVSKRFLHISLLKLLEHVIFTR